MRIRYNVMLVLCMLIALFASAKVVNAAGAQEIILPVALEVSGATGIDINIRLNPEFVDKVEMVSASAIENAFVAAKQTEDKFKVAIASTTPITHKGTLFQLKITLKKEGSADDELFKVLQVKVNERTVLKADNCILLSGVRENVTYRKTVTIGFNEGSATLNGAPISNGTKVTKDGSYLLSVTDLNGRVRNISFHIDTTPQTAKYTVEYYLQNMNKTGYTKQTTDTLSKAGTIGSTVKADAKTYPGFTRVKEVSGIVAQNGSLVLKVYYTRNSYKITYQLNGGTNGSNPSTYVYGVAKSLYAPKRTGYVFAGWYNNREYKGSAITAISAAWRSNVTLYAKWTKVSVTLSKSSLTLIKGKTSKLTAKVAPTTAGSITWSTSNPKIATIDRAGNVKAVAVGKAVVKATVQGVSKTCTIYVAPSASKITKVKKSGTNATITWQKVTGASGYEVSYSSNNKTFTKVKTVSNKVITYKKTAVKKGKTHYMKVRAYALIDGKKVYGAYSTTFQWKQ